MSCSKDLLNPQSADFMCILRDDKNLLSNLIMQNKPQMHLIVLQYVNLQ